MKSSIPSVAVIGSGIAGLGAAFSLKDHAQVTVFEQNATIGGHSHAIDVTLDGKTWPVDVGFLVFNDRTYPQLIALFKELNVDIAESEMSFAVSLGPYDYEWCGSDQLSKALAQPSNAFKPRFWRMIKDMMRFNKEATRLAASTESDQLLSRVSLGEYLEQGRYSQAFRNDYLLPMAAAIWSCPVDQILAFPMHTFVRFCDNHGLLQVNNRPRWKTVRGSSRQYVSKLVSALEASGSKVLVNSPVQGIVRSPQAVQLQVGGQWQTFDYVVMAGHSDQGLRLLGEQASAQEADALAAIAYQPNRTVLHTDVRLMPKRKRAWAAWNYLGKAGTDQKDQDLSVTYWSNCLQPLPFTTQVFVTLNPILEPDPSKIISDLNFSHPVFNSAAITAQKKIVEIQGSHRTFYAGAWLGYGFHEDGLRSGIDAAKQLIAMHGLQTTLQRAA